jgi:integrase
MKDAQVALHKLGVVSKSKQRDRRPTLDELDKLTKHFGVIRARRPSSNPMQPVIAFAIFSTRREDEITRLAWADLDADGSRIMVRDMKHPGDKQGNNQWCELAPEALRIIQARRKTDARISLARLTPSVRPLHGLATRPRSTHRTCQTSCACTSMTYGTRGLAGCSRWGGAFRR